MRLVNIAAKEIAQREYKIRPDIFEIYYDHEMNAVSKVYGGPLVKVMISIGPNDPQFRHIIHDCLRVIPRLYTPVSIVTYGFAKANMRSKWKKDTTPTIKLEDYRLEIRTTVEISVRVRDRLTGESLTLTSESETEYALRQRAIHQLQQRVGSRYAEDDDDQRPLGDNLRNESA